MPNMDPRAALQETLERLSALQPGDAKLQALKAALPDLSAEQAERMLSVLSAQLTDTATDQATSAPSPTKVVSPTTQRLIDTVMDRGGDTDSRVSAIANLEQMKDPAAVPALIDALKDKDLGVRRNAAWALGRMKDPQAVPALIKALKDESSYVRRAAAVALGEIKDPRAVPALIEALKGENDFVRENAAWALQAIGQPAVPALIDALKDESWLVRWKAAWALVGVVSKAALEKLGVS